MKQFVAALGALGLVFAASAACAQSTPPAASKDPATAPAGAYKLDARHTSLIARVGHMNLVSYSIFRFAGVSGTLDWNPAQIEASKVDATVEISSITTPVQGFAEELDGAKFLNTTAFPTAHFVSTSIQRTGPNTGVITGDLTFMGQTHPITLQAELLGAGKTMAGSPVVGFTATAKLKRSDFGYTALIPTIADVIDLVIDTEFDKTK